MKKQLVALGIIGVLVIIGISGCLENNKEDNESIITPTTHLSGKVTVTTNRSEYEQNETINITLYNGLNVSIYSMAASVPSSSCIEHIEKKTSNGWTSFMIRDKNYGDVCYFVWAPREIKPGQKVSFGCIPEIWLNETNNYSALEPGVYRLVISYQIREDNLSENWTGQTVYSNEFYVEKEQIQEVIVTTNKIEYKQNETVNITMFNGLNVSIFSLSASLSAVFSIERIEKKKFGGWQSFFAMGQWPECDYDFDFAAEIKSGESVSFDWKPLIWISGCDNFTQAEPGVYRLLIDSVYSNEFTITGENISDYEPTDINNVVITLERTACYGTCPVYNLTIHGNGTVVYEGKRFVNITGIRTITISDGEVRQLISEFETIDYFSLNDNYTQKIATDMPSATTSISVNGKTKTISHYHGDTSAPTVLILLEDKIDEIVNSSQWID